MAKTSKPLNGITVVDLTRLLAGPFCTMMLADLGARVIKVENPDGGDDARALGPFIEGQSAYFASVNRGKESIALDLKRAEDRAIFDELLDSADVLVENFRPGVMKKLGYDWEQVSADREGLVMASISGFGQTGPYRTLPAYDVVVQAMSGMASINGSEGGSPTRVGTSLGDLAAGLYAAIGIQAALIKRARTGRGEYVDVGMLDCQLALLESSIARFESTGISPLPIGSRHPAIAPVDIFKASDGYLAIVAGQNSHFLALCNTVGLAQLIGDPRFSDAQARLENHAVLKSLLETSLLEKPVSYWTEHLRRADIPSSPVNTIADVVKDSHVSARGMLVEVALSNGKKLSVANCPIRFGNDSQIDVEYAVPTLDEHRESILSALATRIE